MGRILYVFLWLVMVVLDAIANGSGYRRARRFYGSYGRVGYSSDWDMMRPESNPNQGLSSMIRCYLRRSRALKKCSDFCTKADYIITLKNEKVTLLCDTKNKTLTCFDNTCKERTATVIWSSQIGYMPQDKDNIFEITFDNICFSFSAKATYGGILKVLKDNFDDINETGPTPAPTKQPKNEEDEPLKPVMGRLVDINNSTVEQIATLPGINIVLAKRIVKYREEKDGIYSKDEFYREFKIKEHFQKELNRLIVFTNHKKIEESYDRVNKNILGDAANAKKNDDNGKNDSGERIIDF
ncbi:helix-hairpin-helix domain-containing protein [bacterium]|nr:helix-hairpin-helix domain-containing protein [bacterium]